MVKIIYAPGFENAPGTVTIQGSTSALKTLEVPLGQN